MKKLLYGLYFLIHIFYIYAQTPFIQNINEDAWGTWGASYYNEVLRNKKREAIYAFAPYYKIAKPKYSGYDEEFHFWYEENFFVFNTVSESHENTRDNKILLRISAAYYDIFHVNDDKNLLSIQVFVSPTIMAQNDTSSSIKAELKMNWDLINGKSNFTFLFLFDEDYLDIFIDTFDNYFGTYCRYDDSTWQELENLIYINTCDLSNVTFPRRADKTHSGGTTCIVAESLRLRKEENTSSATIQTMQPGTQVQILQLGKKETIDGITANWVQVQLADDTTGWCFGGWLVEK